MTVEDHFSFKREAPERFDWSLVINPKVQSIAGELATEIVCRRAQWEQAEKEGLDPFIPGLQEALRLIARNAVWATMTEDKVQAARLARSGSNQEGAVA